MLKQKTTLAKGDNFPKTRHRLNCAIRKYLTVLRSAPVSSPDLRIHRACYVLRKVFYAYREATWSRFCVSISLTTRHSGLTIITEDLMKLGRKNGWFAEFPQQYFVGNPTAKEKVLVITPCHDIGFLKKLVEQLFAGLDVHIEEVKVRLKPLTECTVIAVESGEGLDFTPYRTHWCMRITLPSTGKQTALDITGVQYGISHGDMPWESQLEFFVDEVQVVKPFGTLEKFAEEMATFKGTEGLEYDVAAGAIEAWHQTVDAAMGRKGLTWADVLQKPEADYERHTKKIISVGTSAMQKYAAVTKLTKRRNKAERYEERHEDQLEGEAEELEMMYLE
ncbi:hypothetical protein G6011_01651 [Alternaria panax]|uniref:Uncharacterized protein n=1 Tax=Alternaria panax TaxID=48097 RepID=A0AAD4IKX3_9PLEO|nr:hypothetical protein G6011_01651 [Alternaria panax]